MPSPVLSAILKGMDVRLFPGTHPDDDYSLEEYGDRYAEALGLRQTHTVVAIDGYYHYVEINDLSDFDSSSLKGNLIEVVCVPKQTWVKIKPTLS